MIFKEAVKNSMEFFMVSFSVGAVILQPFLSVRKQNSMIEKTQEEKCPGYKSLDKINQELQL